MNIPPLCFVRFARPAPIIQRGIFWYSVYRHLRLLVSPALLGDLECFINNLIVCNQAGKINYRLSQLQNPPLAASSVCYGK